MATRNIFVSGVTGNLGKVIAQKFKQEGDRLYGISHSDLPSTISLDGFMRVNLTDASESAQKMDEFLERIGRIDVLVSTVGGFVAGNITALKQEELATMFNLNFFATINVVMPVFRRMIGQGEGRIFLIGAKAGLAAGNRTGAVAYGLSKMALTGFAESLNLEGEKHNVIASLVVPSTIDTPQNRASMPDGDFGAWVTPEQLAFLIYFYASNEANILRQPVLKAYGKA